MLFSNDILMNKVFEYCHHSNELFKKEALWALGNVITGLNAEMLVELRQKHMKEILMILSRSLNLSDSKLQMALLDTLIFLLELETNSEDEMSISVARQFENCDGL